MSSNSDKPQEFDQIIKPAPVEKKTATTTTTKEKEKEDTFVPLSNSTIQEALRNSPTFTKFREDLNDAQIKNIRALAPMQEFTIEVDGEQKTYTKKKITRKNYKELEMLRARLSKSRDTEEIASINDEILEKAANYYLGMTPEEFDNADYESVKRILDTCNIVTVQGVPSS